MYQMLRLYQSLHYLFENRTHLSGFDNQLEHLLAKHMVHRHKLTATNHLKVHEGKLQWKNKTKKSQQQKIETFLTK